jgi:hypothetical protein
MNESPELLDEERGLYPKYRAFEVDSDGFPNGSLYVSGQPVKEITDPFFLMKFNDPCCWVALELYAHMKAKQYPKLAEDIRLKVKEARLNAQIERLHGPGAGEALDAAISDDSIYGGK